VRILVVGAGAIGSVVGAALTEAGQDVTLAETDAEHLAAIRAAGLRMEGWPAERTVPVRARWSLLWERRVVAVFMAGSVERGF
jgi:2-dehydropantoate 2-reductase